MAKTPTPKVKAPEAEVDQTGATTQLTPEQSDAKVEAKIESAGTELAPDAATVGNAGNTQSSEDVQVTDKDVASRGSVAVDAIVARTGQLPTDVKALEAELEDQVRTEAEAQQKAAVLDQTGYDALTLERLDHARTLKQALGLSSQNDADANRRLAEERNAVLKDKQRDTSKDNVHNSRPANWIVQSVDDESGEVVAYNRITGKEYKGPAADLIKQATNVGDKKDPKLPEGTEA
jgi:hypothetical protein